MGDLVMDEYHYTILYRREQLGTYKYLYLPCYVIKGLYDEKENIFLDELNKYRFLYNDFCSISDSTGYCVGEVYTEKELREKFPKANSLEDLEIKLIESQEFKTLIGCFDIMNHKVIFNTIDNTNEQKEYAILSSNGIANSKSKMAETTNEKMLSDDEDEYRVSYEELEEMLDADDIEEIKNILIDAINNTDFDTEESYVFFPEKLVNAFLNSNDIEAMKSDISRLCNFLDESREEVKKNLVKSLYILNDYIDKMNLQNIDSYVDFSYKKIMNAETKNDAINVITELIDYDLEVLDALDYSKEEIGIDFFRSRTFFYVQSQLLNKIRNGVSLESIKSKYDKFYNITRKNVDGVLDEINDIIGIDLEEDREKDECTDINKKVDNTMSKLNALVGLEDVKSSFQEIFDTIIFKQKTKDNLSFEEGSKHMVFTGNPGTGKTTVAEIIAPLFHEVGYLESDKVSYVSAQNLIGKYVGQTAPKTEKVIKDNLGGIIVLDEAYILAGKAQEFGNEAITVMLKEMEKNRTMFIFAGYKKEMEDFIKMNSGLESRIGTFLEFKDYSEDELFEIFKKNIDKVNDKENQEYKLTMSEEAVSKVKGIISEAKQITDFGNGRFAKKLFDKISRCHAKNTRSTDDPNKLYQITEKDIPDDIMKTIFFSGDRSSGLYSGGKIGFRSEEDKPKVYKKGEK
jgi:stage V sporulation protein K